MHGGLPDLLSRAMARHTRWVDRWRLPILAASVVALVAAAFLAMRLPLKSDLSSLLPPSKQSVRDLDVLKHRARAFGNVLVMIEAPTVEMREAAGKALETKLRALDKSLVSSVSMDDAATARFVWAHRWLYVEQADLELARDALAERLRDARLDANPLFIDLDDEDDAAKAAPDDKLKALQARIEEAEANATQPPLRLSPDGRAQLVTMQVTFPSSNVEQGRIVMRDVRAIGAELERTYPGLVVEYAGAVNISIFEHDSVVAGMATAAAITVILVFGALFLYYKAVFAVGAVLWSLIVGVAGTLAFTQLTIGHLNVMSAFLAAIVIGNGINTGLVVLSRYFEEVRARSGDRRIVAQEAIGPALAGALPGTLAAALTAAVAYGSLIVTDFRGFRHFGVIGAVGMLLCWLTAYTVLPAALAVLARWGRIRPGKPPRLGAVIARLFPRNVKPVIAAGAAVTAVSIGLVVWYIAGDPFAKDWRELQSDGPEIRAQRVVDQKMLKRFDNKLFGGHSFQLVIAVDDRAQVRPIVESIRAREAKRPKGQELFTEVRSIDDLVPPAQDKKLPVLAEIRALLDDPAIAQLSPEERAQFDRMRPPADLQVLTERDVPMEIGWPFIEQDGSVGRLIFAKGSPRFRTWNVDDRVAFASLVRELELPPGALIGGEPLVIADIIESMEEDGPKMIAFSLLGSIIAVWLVVGRRRHGVVTLVCGLAGVVLMIALCALVGLPVHFLDLIALPITIGIGIDYAVNLAARDREDGERGPRHLLATIGGAVLLCSYTTTVGYGSLIVSSNGGIRAFGIAAILGEVACIAMALLLAPALLSWLRARAPTPA